MSLESILAGLSKEDLERLIERLKLKQTRGNYPIPKDEILGKIKDLMFREFSNLPIELLIRPKNKDARLWLINYDLLVWHQNKYVKYKDG